MATRGGTAAGTKVGTATDGATDAAGAAGDAEGLPAWAHAVPASIEARTILVSAMLMDIKRIWFMDKECAPTAHCVAARIRKAIALPGFALAAHGPTRP